MILTSKDLKGAATVDQIKEKLQLNKRKTPWHVQPATATTGDGVIEGLDWLVEQLK